MRLRSLFATPVLLATLGLTACGAPSAPPAASSPPQTSAPAPAPAAAPQYADLRGTRAAGGESTLERRGFSLSRRQGLTQFWIHEPSRTCLRVVTSGGRYTTVDPVAMSNCPT